MTLLMALWVCETHRRFPERETKEVNDGTR